LILKHRAFEFTHFARQRRSGELDYSSVDGNVPAKGRERADYPILTDHRGFYYLSRGKTRHKRDNGTCWKVDVCDLISGFEQNPLMVQIDGFQVWPKSRGITL
jgi:hypothetical protein